MHILHIHLVPKCEICNAQLFLRQRLHIFPIHTLTVRRDCLVPWKATEIELIDGRDASVDYIEAGCVSGLKPPDPTRGSLGMDSKGDNLVHFVDAIVGLRDIEYAGCANTALWFVAPNCPEGCSIIPDAAIICAALSGWRRGWRC